MYVASFPPSHRRLFKVEPVLWAVGATALVSFSLSLFALQSKVRSVTYPWLSLQWSQKWHSIKCSEWCEHSYIQGCVSCVVQLSCWQRHLHAVISNGLKSDGFAVQATLWLLLRSVYLPLNLILGAQHHTGWGSDRKSRLQRWPGVFCYSLDPFSIPSLWTV